MDAPHPITLAGKHAVVTGGSGSLGSAVARGLAQAGAHVAITGRSMDSAQTVTSAIVESGGKAYPYTMDAHEVESVRQCAQEVLRQFGAVDVLVNCIGGNMEAATTSEERTVFELSVRDLSAVLDLNWMRGVVLPSQVFGEIMIENPGGGSIINVSSMAASRPLTRVAAYSSAKAAVENFTKWLAVYLAQEYSPKLRVNAIAPGFFLSDQNRFLLETEDGGLTDRGQKIIGQTPMARFGEPEEVAGAVIWLASDAARFVTGIVVPIDGGFSAYAGV